MTEQEFEGQHTAWPEIVVETKPVAEFHEKDQPLIAHIDEVLAEVAVPEVVKRPQKVQVRHPNRHRKG